ARQRRPPRHAASPAGHSPRAAIFALLATGPPRHSAGTLDARIARMPAGQYSKDPAIDRALRHSVRDGMAYSIAAGGGETYFSAFALFCGATAPQVALLTTLPPLLGSLAQILSAWLGNFVGRKRLILTGATLQAFTWLPIIALPFWFPDQAVAILLALFALYHGAGNLVAPQWTSMMRDLVSERRRGRYFGHRTRLTTLTSFAALVLCGA